MSDRLSGKIVLLSGAARGQGAAEAELFADEGARVVIGDVLETELAATAARIEARHPGRVEALRLDVTSPDDWRAAVAAAEARFGGLHVLVNNAGITNQRFGGLQPIESLPLQAWNALLAVNLTGSFLGIQAAIPLLRRTIERARAKDPHATGSIVNISSAQAILPSAGQANYAASKWGQRGLTRVAAAELGPLVRVNSVHPGPIDTAMVQVSDPSQLDSLVADMPLRRIGTPEEVARLVLFLASDESSFCTGSEFLVEGGRTAATVTRG
ncbi:MAG: SDR family oxidoreductase [Myxococcota bacterium]